MIAQKSVIDELEDAIANKEIGRRAEFPAPGHGFVRIRLAADIRTIRSSCSTS